MENLKNKNNNKEHCQNIIIKGGYKIALLKLAFDPNVKIRSENSDE